jgi:hypothetical protein
MKLFLSVQLLTEYYRSRIGRKALSFSRHSADEVDPFWETVGVDIQDNH